MFGKELRMTMLLLADVVMVCCCRGWAGAVVALLASVMAGAAVTTVEVCGSLDAKEVSLDGGCTNCLAAAGLSSWASSEMLGLAASDPWLPWLAVLVLSSCLRRAF